MKIYCFRVQRYKKYTKQPNYYEKKMSSVQEETENTLIENCPLGYGVNVKALKGIAKGLIRTNWVCPCSHEEWTKETPHEDKLCPCKTFRETGDCHCNLYIKIK